MAGRDELVRQADELDDRAQAPIGEAARDLRRQAAELRLQALGEKPYPVLICSGCFRLTGWLGSGERCEACINRDQLEAAYHDPHGGFVDLSDPRAPERPASGPPRRARLSAALGRRRALEEARGCRLGGARRSGRDRAGAPGGGLRRRERRARRSACAGRERPARPLLRLGSCVQDGAWRPTLRTGGPTPLTPHVFPAFLPMEQLAEAWSDYCGEVDAFNRALWAAEEERREQQRQAEEALAQTRREQRGTSDLLGR